MIWKICTTDVYVDNINYSVLVITWPQYVSMTTRMSHVSMAL